METDLSARNGAAFRKAKELDAEPSAARIHVPIPPPIPAFSGWGEGRKLSPYQTVS